MIEDPAVEAQSDEFSTSAIESEGWSLQAPEGGSLMTPPAVAEGHQPTDSPHEIPSPGPGRAVKLVLGLVSVALIAAGFFLMRDRSENELVRPGGPTIGPGGLPFEDGSGSTAPGGGSSQTLPGGGNDKGAPSPEETPDPDEGKPFGALKFEVKIIPECGEVGRAMRAEITTTPGAAITLAVVYKDGQTYGQWGTFRADPTGKLIYPWTVPPTAPEGLARFLAGADDESRRESAAGYWNFTVRSVGGC